MEVAHDVEARVHETSDSNNPDTVAIQLPRSRCLWWLLVGLNAFLLLAGQCASILLGRLYFQNGGTSKWSFTVFQFAGFPFLAMYFFISPAMGRRPTNTKRKKLVPLTSVYVTLGLLFAGYAFLASVGLSYLPASTFTLISASQLAFNAFFSYILNKEKLTPYTFNSVFLLTISSILLVFSADSGSSGNVSTGKHVLGFLCALGSSAAFGLCLSLTQFAFQRVIKDDSLSSIVNLNFYQSMVSALIVLIGLFASGEWRRFVRDMENYKLGKVSYLMTLIWTSLSWQIAAVGGVGLIIKVSALFSNVVAAMVLPIVPVLAAVFFHEKMDGIKGVTLVLAVWGFISYGYQTYIDEKKSRTPAGDAAGAGTCTETPKHPDADKNRSPE